MQEVPGLLRKRVRGDVIQTQHKQRGVDDEQAVSSGRVNAI